MKLRSSSTLMEVLYLKEDSVFLYVHIYIYTICIVSYRLHIVYEITPSNHHPIPPLNLQPFPDIEACCVKTYVTDV